MKYWPITAIARARMAGVTSIYDHECPTCGSPPGHWCAALDNSGKRFGGYHRARAANPHVHTPLPDLRVWFREQGKLEAEARKIGNRARRKLEARGTRRSAQLE